jgi:arsenate reductase (glutaredoxin)
MGHEVKNTLPARHRPASKSPVEPAAARAARERAFPKSFASVHREATRDSSKFPYDESYLQPDDCVEVQIFGVNKSADTRKALRFFAERRIKTHYVDLNVRAASAGELQRFAQMFGAEALIDRGSRRFADLGLQYTVLSPERWIQKLSEEPMILKMPLVRNGKNLTVGVAEKTWKEWLE